MAHIDDGKGGRSANIDVNIVPFIDLMSVLIIFLLINAVWIQISVLQIGSSLYGKKTEEESPPPPKDENKKDIFLRLDVKPSGFFVLIDKKTVEIPKLRGQYDRKALLKELKKLKSIYPHKEDAFINVSESLPYGELIEGMDMLLVSQFPEISIITGTEKES